MPYGERVINPAGDRAEGDKLFEQSVYWGPSGSLSIGMPVVKDVTDAAEWNTKLTATALVGVSASFVVPPGVVRTGGRALLTTGANGSINGFVGVYAPENPADRPNQGDIIRVLVYGEGIVSAISQTGNANALTVGSLLGLLATQTSAIALGNTPVARQTVGLVLATTTALTTGAVIQAAAGNVAVLVNCFVNNS
jgi:hypothetical protein